MSDFPTDPANPLLSIIMPNWEGEAWLERALSSLQVSARAHGRGFEIIVVDDASRDSSVEIVRRRFPRVRLLQNPRNLGFGRSVMRGVKVASAPILLLVNNDLVAQEPFVGSLCRWFEPGAPPRPEGPLFAVSARTLAWWDGKPNQVCMGAHWRGGRITPSWKAPEGPAACLFVQAGAAAYDRNRFLELGGLSGIYEPGYWEDYDLSFRAARRGWVNMYDPAATALHVGGGSMTRRFGADGVERLKARNHLLFEWANITDPLLLAHHFARLPLGIAREWLSGRGLPLTHAVTDGVLRLRGVLAARRREPRPIVPDRELLRRFGFGEASF